LILRPSSDNAQFMRPVIVNRFPNPVLRSRNHRLEQERDTGSSRQNDKEVNEHVRRTSHKSRNSQIVLSMKRRWQRIERSCSNSQNPIYRITGIYRQSEGKRSSDRSSLETSSNQRI